MDQASRLRSLPARGVIRAALGLAMTAALTLPGGGSLAAEPRAVTATPTLDMFEQLSLQRRAVRILAMPQVQAQKRRTEDLFRRSWIADTPDGRARLEYAAGQFAMASVEDALLDDPVRPRIMWIITPPGNVHGIQWPGSNWGSLNPDNFSRRVMMDGASQYEISGQRTGPGPAQETFNLADSIVGTQAQSVEGAKVVATLKTEDIHVAPDGSYTITIGPEPSGPEGNHLQSVPGRNVLEIRNTLNDWWNEVPNRLRIRRVSGPFAPARSDEAIADEAAALMAVQVPYWLKFNQQHLYDGPPNTTVSISGKRPGGWGYISSGWFKLNDDEALVVTVAPMGAKYMAVQVADLWSSDPDYINRQSGLNKTQAKANPDGTYTYVIAARDPGVWNWVDTVGLHMGGYAIRRQALADTSITNATAIQSTRLVKIADLKAALPAGTTWTGPGQRRKQLEDRAASFARRLAN